MFFYIFKDCVSKGVGGGEGGGGGGFSSPSTIQPPVSLRPSLDPMAVKPLICLYKVDFHSTMLMQLDTIRILAAKPAEAFGLWYLVFTYDL